MGSHHLLGIFLLLLWEYLSKNEFSKKILVYLAIGTIEAIWVIILS
jgi:hypothetical protein